MSWWPDPSSWTDWNQYPYGYAYAGYYPVQYQAYPHREYRPAPARTVAGPQSRGRAMPQPVHKADEAEKAREEGKGSQKTESEKESNQDEDKDESEESESATSPVVVDDSNKKKDAKEEKSKKKDHRKKSRSGREATKHQSRPSDGGKPAKATRPATSGGAMAPRSPVEPPKSKEASTLDPQIQCTMCGKWVSKRGFEQHWLTNLTCIQKQKASKGEKPDVDKLHEWLQCTYCHKWCQGEYGLQQHMDSKHPKLQSFRRRSRSPSGSGSAGPSASQVGPVSVVSSRRPTDRGHHGARSAISLRENNRSHGSRGSVVGDGTGSTSESLADLFQATANMLRR
eukprot:Skav219584  [mRNA]  locus=scaffold249:258421:259440:- [translate_table: standard]